MGCLINKYACQSGPYDTGGGLLDGICNALYNNRLDYELSCGFSMGNPSIFSSYPPRMIPTLWAPRSYPVSCMCLPGAGYFMGYSPWRMIPAYGSPMFFPPPPLCYGPAPWQRSPVSSGGDSGGVDNDDIDSADNSDKPKPKKKPGKTDEKGHVKKSEKVSQEYLEKTQDTINKDPILGRMFAAVPEPKNPNAKENVPDTLQIIPQEEDIGQYLRGVDALYGNNDESVKKIFSSGTADVARASREKLLKIIKDIPENTILSINGVQFASNKGTINVFQPDGTGRFIPIPLSSGIHPDYVRLILEGANSARFTDASYLEGPAALRYLNKAFSGIGNALGKPKVEINQKDIKLTYAKESKLLEFWDDNVAKNLLSILKALVADGYNVTIEEMKIDKDTTIEGFKKLFKEKVLSNKDFKEATPLNVLQACNGDGKSIGGPQIKIDDKTAPKTIDMTYGSEVSLDSFAKLLGQEDPQNPLDENARKIKISDLGKFRQMIGCLGQLEADGYKVTISGGSLGSFSKIEGSADHGEVSAVENFMGSINRLVSLNELFKKDEQDGKGLDNPTVDLARINEREITITYDVTVARDDLNDLVDTEGKTKLLVLRDLLQRERFTSPEEQKQFKSPPVIYGLEYLGYKVKVNFEGKEYATFKDFWETGLGLIAREGGGGLHDAGDVLEGEDVGGQPPVEGEKTETIPGDSDAPDLPQGEFLPDELPSRLNDPSAPRTEFNPDGTVRPDGATGPSSGLEPEGDFVNPLDSMAEENGPSSSFDDDAVPPGDAEGVIPGPDPESRVEADAGGVIPGPDPESRADIERGSPLTPDDDFADALQPGAADNSPTEAFDDNAVLSGPQGKDAAVDQVQGNAAPFDAKGYADLAIQEYGFYLTGTQKREVQNIASQNLGKEETTQKIMAIVIKAKEEVADLWDDYGLVTDLGEIDRYEGYFRSQNMSVDRVKEQMITWSITVSSIGMAEESLAELRKLAGLDPADAVSPQDLIATINDRIKKGEIKIKDAQVLIEDLAAIDGATIDKLPPDVDGRPSWRDAASEYITFRSGLFAALEANPLQEPQGPEPVQTLQDQEPEPESVTDEGGTPPEDPGKKKVLEQPIPPATNDTQTRQDVLLIDGFIVPLSADADVFPASHKIGGMDVKRVESFSDFEKNIGKKGHRYMVFSPDSDLEKLIPYLKERLTAMTGQDKKEEAFTLLKYSQGGRDHLVLVECGKDEKGGEVGWEYAFVENLIKDPSTDEGLIVGIHTHPQKVSSKPEEVMLVVVSPEDVGAVVDKAGIYYRDLGYEGEYYELVVTPHGTHFLRLAPDAARQGKLDVVKTRAVEGHRSCLEGTTINSYRDYAKAVKVDDDVTGAVILDSRFEYHSIEVLAVIEGYFGLEREVRKTKEGIESKKGLRDVELLKWENDKRFKIRNIRNRAETLVKKCDGLIAAGFADPQIQRIRQQAARRIGEANKEEERIIRMIAVVKEDLRKKGTMAGENGPSGQHGGPASK